MARRFWSSCIGMLAVLAASASSARAQDAMFGPDTLHGMAELNWGAADAERSWLDGGFGKTAFSGGSSGGWKGRASLSQAVLEWKPQFSFAVSGVVSAQYQDRVHPGLDLDEAYLKLRLPPLAAGRLLLRAGVFYPPVSLEHPGIGWTTTDLLSASALNSWIGEEVKVGGVEAAYARRFGEHEITATAAVFGWNDTSGTLLSFRGWTLDGIRTGLRTEFELPPLSAFMQSKQADETYPMWELDHRAGYYGRLEWRPPQPVVIDAFFYDNRGNRIAVRDLQWSWETRFANLGATWQPTERTSLRAQVLSGETWMGYATPEVWVDVKYRAAYLLVTHSRGADSLSGRLDWFQTRDRTYTIIDNNDETGWAATLGWRHRVTANADLLLETQHVRSNRPSRALALETPTIGQNVVQSALRLHF